MASKKGAFISFKFVRPMGLALTDRGIYNPRKIDSSVWVSGWNRGPVPTIEYDFDYVFELSLLPEKPDPLPEYLADEDEDLKKEYRLSQLKQVVENAKINDLTRKELHNYEESGYIVIVSDSQRQRKKAVEPEAAASSSPSESKRRGRSGKQD